MRETDGCRGGLGDGRSAAPGRDELAGCGHEGVAGAGLLPVRPVSSYDVDITFTVP